MDAEAFLSDSPAPPAAPPDSKSAEGFLADAAPKAPAASVPNPSNNDWLTKPAEKKPGLLERGKKVAEEAGIGGILGTFSPEITGLAAAGLSAFPPTAPFGVALSTTVPAMRATRLAQSGIGAIAGGAGEIGAQIAEAYKQPEKVQEIVRLAAGAITPEFGGLIKYAGQKLVSKLTGASLKDIAGALADDLGIEVNALTPEQRTYIEKIAGQIRAGEKTDDPLKSLYSHLDAETQKIVQRYTDAASSLSFKADRLQELAERGVISGERVTTYATDLSEGAQTLVREAQDSANAILKEAEKRAAQARGRGTESKMSEVDAQDILQRGKQQADQILSEAQTRATRLRQIADRARESAGKRMEGATASVAKVGEADLPTKTGNRIRDSVMPVFEKLKGVRAENAERLKGEAFGVAQEKEALGQFAHSTAAFEKAVKEIEDEIATTSLPNVKNPLQTILKAIGKQTEVGPEGAVQEVIRNVTFKDLETTRRFLRDRSYGLPAEGFDAINQQLAGKLANLVEDIQREFSPGIESFLKQYATDSAPLTIFKTKLGRAVGEKEDFDMGLFLTDPADVGKKFFRTDTGVKDLIAMLGGDASAAEEIARGFVMDKLRKPNAESIQKFLASDSVRDWIDNFPVLKEQLQDAVRRMGGAEAVTGKRTALSKALRSESSKLLDSGPIDAAGTLAKADKESGVVSRRAQREQNLAQAREQKASGIASQGATKAGEGLRETGKKLSAEGEKIRELILGKKFDARRVQQIILSGDKALWAEVGPLIAASPSAKESFASAVGQVLADKALASPKAVVEIFNKDVRPAIEAAGLMTAPQLKSLQAKIDQINKTVDSPRKAGLIQRAITNALTAEAASSINSLTDPFGTMARLYRGGK